MGSKLYRRVFVMVVSFERVSVPLNPFMPSGIFSLSLSNLRVCFIVLSFIEEIPILNANSVDPD